MNVQAMLAHKGDKVVTARPEATVATIIHVMKIEGIGAVVISRDVRRIDGIVSERDVVRGLVAHGGALWTNARSAYGDSVDTLYDARVGVVFDIERFTVQVSWVGISNANVGYGLTGVRSRNGPVISVSWLF